jgi:type I restriction enzyme S subunit
MTIHLNGSVSKRVLAPGRAYTMEMWRAQPGDIVVAKIDLKSGAVGIVPKDWGNVAVTGHFAVYIPDRSKVLPEYLHRLIQTDFFKAHLWRNKVGAEGRKEVKLDFFESENIPLPPLPIQQAIVDHWKQAQERVAEAKRKADEHEAQTEQDFLASLGMSTPKQINRPKFLALRFEQIERWAVASVINQVLNLDRRVEGIFPIVDLGELATVSYGLQKSPSNRPGLFARPYLRVANVRKGFLDLSEIKEIEVSDRELPAYLLQPDDILFVEGNGSRAELGRVAKWNGEIKNCVHQNHLIKVRVDQKRILPDYAMTWFNTELGRSHFFRSAKSSSGLGTINSSEVRKAPIPLPPLDIQRKLVAEITAARKRIASERAAAAKLAADSAREVEEMILGYRPAPNT